MTESIPLASPAIDERERELVAEVLGSRRLALGPMIERFEANLAAAVDAPFAVAVSNGTAGLHLAVRMAEIAEGDEVITTPFSFVASANCALYEGARPVFVDIDRETFNLDPAAVESAITPRTRALLPVDIFGYPVELEPLREIASKYGLALIQDACEALGARYRGQAVGSFGHPTVFAFYPNKQITTGEGGAVVFGTEDEYHLAKSLSNQGRADSGGWLEHARLGFNYRMSEVTAAIGVAQLEKLAPILAARSAAAERYTERFAEDARLETPCADDPDHQRCVVRLRRQARRPRRPGARYRRAGRGRRRDEPLSALDPPPALHARAVRVRRRDVSGQRGHECAHARASVLHRDNRGAAGAGRHRADTGARCRLSTGTDQCMEAASALVARDFFLRPAVEVAQSLIGCTLSFDRVGGRIVEAEAYDQSEPASHTFIGPTDRNQTMFGPAGRVYVYRSYGIHWCMNLVCEDDRASAVLIRALEPLEGLGAMRRRRGRSKPRELCSGPGKLCQALAITREHDGLSTLSAPFRLSRPSVGPDVVASPRIGISKATALMWRFSERDSEYVSRPVPR